MVNMRYQFETFVENVRMSDRVVDTVRSRRDAIQQTINKCFWNGSTAHHCLYVGSYGRNTAIFASDIDLIVSLPWSMYYQYDAYSSNGQSALLQMVREALLCRYPKSDIRGDGQIVSLDFTDRMLFEIVPSFELSNGGFYYPDTHDGGSWKSMNPRIELSAMKQNNQELSGRLYAMCRGIRAWNYYNSVNIPGYLIDSTVYDFINNNQNKHNYDYGELFLGYFEYLKDNNYRSYWYMPGSRRQVPKEISWRNDVSNAIYNSEMALDYASDGYTYSACKYWRYVFGTAFPER